MLQSPRKKNLPNSLQVPTQISQQHSHNASSNKSLSDVITNLSSQDSLQYLKKEEFKSIQKMQYQHNSEQNQINNKVFLNDQRLQKQKKKLMQIKITNNGSSIDGDSSTTSQFVSKIIDEEQLHKKQSLQKNYQKNMYAKIDSYAFKTFLNVQKNGDISLRSSPLLGSQSGSSLNMPVSSNNLQSKPNIIQPNSAAQINDIYSSNFQPSQSFYNQTSKPLTPRKKCSFYTNSYTNSSYAAPGNNQKSLKIIDDQSILQGSIKQVFSGFLTQRRNHSSTFLDQLQSPSAKNIVSHNQFIRGQLGKRQDALQVKNYLEIKIKELLSKEPLTKDDIFILRQNIYSSCLEELIRQISIDCKERAFVLQEIWDSTMELMTNLFIFLEKQKSQIEKDLSINIQELHLKYQKTINEDLKIINKQQTQIADRNNFIEKQIQENRYLRKKDKKLEKLYKMSQNSINYLQDELNSSIREHLKYIMSHEELTWREALEYQRRYFELTKNKRTSVQKSIKEIALQIRMHVDQNEIQQHIDMDEILKEYIIDPVENQLQNIIQEIDNEQDQTDLKIGFNLDDQDFIKSNSTQTDFSIFNLVEKEVNTDNVLITEMANKKNKFVDSVDSAIQCKAVTFPIFTQTEIHELCSCAQQTEYTGDIMDIKVGEEYWDKDLNNSFFEQFNKKCVAVQTVKEIQIRIPSETEIELDSLKGTHISMELKNIIETAIKKEYISTEGLYECKKLIEQKIQIQEKLVRNVKDKFMRHQQTELEMSRQKTDLENQLQIEKDQNQIQMSKLLHLSEDYNKLQNIMMIKVEELSFESMDSDLIIDQTSRTQLMNTTLQQQPFDSEETKQIIDNQDQSKLNRKVSMISAYSGSQNSQRQITALSELDMRNYKSRRSVSEIKQIPQQHDQFKKRYSNHQSLTQQNKEVYTSQPGVNQIQGRKNSQQRGQQDTSINVSNMKRTSFSSSVQPYHQQSNHLNSITSMPDTSQERYKENGGEDNSQCSSEFRIPSLKDIDKDEPDGKKRQRKNTTKQEANLQINNNFQNPTKSLNVIPFSQLTRNNVKTTSIHTEAANNLLIEISRKFIKCRPDLKKNKYLPQINKTLSMVYSDLIKLVKNNNALNPLHVVTYEQFIHRFGLQKIAEQKMIQEIQQAMLMANENNRCKVFIKMLYAQEGANITSEDKIEEVKFFVNCLLLLDDSKQAQNYNVDKSFTSTVRVHESFPKIFADILNERQIFENMTKLIKYPAETIKEIQNNDYRRLPAPSYEQLDIDLHLDLLLQIYSNRFEKN
ncbi:hypothetical protein ABPG72_014483 [Tetrahymena utriculariae]